MKKLSSVWSEAHQRWKEFPEGSMISAVRAAAERTPLQPALEFYGNKTTYAELMEQVEACAAAFLGMGIGKGDFVSIVTPNVPQGVVAFYAANRIGAIGNMLHPSLSKEELRYAIGIVKSRLVVTLDMIYPKFASMEWEDGAPAFLLAGIADALPWFKRPFYRMKNKSEVRPNPKHTVFLWKDFVRKSHAPLPPDVGKGEDDAVVLYSGGTTGKPKGILLSNDNFNCLAVSTVETYSSDDVDGMHSLALMPIFHAFGLGTSVHAMLCISAHVFLVPVYDMVATTKLIFRRKISFIYGVPALFQALSRCEEIETKDCGFMKLLVAAGDYVSPQLLRRLNRQLKNAGAPTELREAYGQTECASGCCINPYFDLREGSMGLPYSNIEMKIVDHDTCEELPRGEIGEICVSGPTVMKGYLFQEELTKTVLRVHSDGKTWLHTNDMGYQDKDGFFYYSHRRIRMIISSGYNVYPGEVEDAIEKCPFVRQCCVVGKKDTVLGERISAFVVLNDSTLEQGAAKKEILEVCRSTIPEFALPHDIVFREALPQSAFGKVDYRQLVE